MIGTTGFATPGSVLPAKSGKLPTSGRHRNKAMLVLEVDLRLSVEALAHRMG
jgi:hypothetical protein